MIVEADGPLSFPFFPPALAEVPAAGGGTSAAPPARAAQKPYLEAGNHRDQAPARRERQDEKLSRLVNELIENGSLVRTAAGWKVRPILHTATRPPDAGDDDRADAWEGDTWIDTATGDVYVCTSAARGAAVWVLTGLGA